MSLIHHKKYKQSIKKYIYEFMKNERPIYEIIPYMGHSEGVTKNPPKFKLSKKFKKA